MPRLQQAKKALRQSEKRRVLNDTKKRALKEAVKTVKKTVKTEAVKMDSPILSKAYKNLDKAAKAGVIKKGTASRMKSRLSKAGKKAATK